MKLIEDTNNTQTRTGETHRAVKREKCDCCLHIVHTCRFEHIAHARHRGFLQPEIRISTLHLFLSHLISVREPTDYLSYVTSNKCWAKKTWENTYCLNIIWIKCAKTRHAILMNWACKLIWFCSVFCGCGCCRPCWFNFVLYVALCACLLKYLFIYSFHSFIYCNKKAL